MYCPACGTKNTDEALFCQNCGTKLRQTQPAQQAPVQAPAQVPAQGAPTVETSAPVATVQEAAQPAVATSEPPAFTPPPTWQAPATPQQPVFQPSPKQKMKPLTKVLIAVVVFLVLAAAGLAILVSQLNDPKRTVKGYFDSIMTENWSKAYTYVNLHNSHLTSEAAYREFMPQQQSDDKEPYTIQDIRLEQEPAGAGKRYTVYYTAGTNPKVRTYNISLLEPQSKWLVLKTYKVDMGDMLCEDVTIQVPTKAKVYVDTIPITEDLKSDQSSDSMDIYEIPVMFKGNHTIKVKTDFAADYEHALYVDDDTTFAAKEFTLNETTLDALLDKTGEAINALYRGASEGKSFDTVKQYFAADEQKSVQEDYEYLMENIQFKDGVGLTDVKISNFEMISSSAYDFQDNALMLNVSCEATYTRHYLDDWSYEIVTVTPPTPEQMTIEITYTYENGQWVIVALY